MTELLSPGHRASLERRAGRVEALRSALADRFPERASVVLEIGCGHGHYLCSFASAHPDIPCLGIDLVTRRIEKAQAKQAKRGLACLHFLKAEAGECLDAWPDWLTIDRIFMLFPDPWPKKRHTKNRLLQPHLLDSLAKAALPGACLHFRTDHLAHLEWARSVIEAHPHWVLDEQAPWPHESPSYFQDLFSHHVSFTARRLP